MQLGERGIIKLGLGDNKNQVKLINKIEVSFFTAILCDLRVPHGTILLLTLAFTTLLSL